MIYLDNSATTYPKPQGVRQAVQRAFTDFGANPGRSGYGMCLRTTQAVYQVRQQAAEFFGAPGPECVLFQPSCTQALNVVLKGFLKPGDHVVITDLEHNAVTRPLHAIGGVSVRIVNGRLFDPDQMAEGFDRAVGDGVKAVVCTHVSNVFGYALPMDDISAVCRRKGVPLIVDASQSAGVLPVDLKKWGAAYVAMPGHKGLYGPQGTGLLLCGEGYMPRPLLEGGTGSLSRLQEMPDFLPDRLEAGTHNVHGAVGLLEGLRFVRRLGPGQAARHEMALLSALAGRLRRTGRYRVFDGGGTVLSVVPLDTSPEELADTLAQRGVAVRAGLHCAPLAHITAGTVQTGTLRFSMSVFNTMEEVEQVAEMLS